MKLARLGSINPKPQKLIKIINISSNPKIILWKFMKIPFQIYPSITGCDNIAWQSKLEEINKLKLKEVAVFLSCFDKEERDYLLKSLPESSIERVPFVHLRHDTNKQDIEFFIKNYGTKYFNIHEDSFDILNQWKPYWGRLYLEMNYDNQVDENVKVKNIGGFCIDLSHFKASIDRGTKEAEYILSRKDKIKFSCNHLNGYDPISKKDKHTITDLKDFGYLTTLPKFVFSEIIALEVFNPIREQLEFREYLEKILGDYL